jgi:hypothetical protein
MVEKLTASSLNSQSRREESSDCIVRRIDVERREGGKSKDDVRLVGDSETERVTVNNDGGPAYVWGWRWRR